VTLSLDIMMTAGAFVVLETGAAPDVPPCEGRWARPGSETMAQVRDGSHRNLGDPTTATSPSRMVHGMTTDQALAEHLRREGAKRETPWRGPGARIHKRAGGIVGSRSAFVVPTTSGNSAREDPIEGRGAPPEQPRVWETRRAL
jgi:hypothetical protein